MASKLFGIEATRQELFKDLGLGLLAGAGFIAFSSIITGISIGVPQVPLASAGESLLITVGLAPVVEEITFRGMLHGLMAGLLKFKRAITIGVTALAFSAFHLLAFRQGAYFAVQSPFVGAFVFGLIASLLLVRSNNLMSPIVFHGIVNAFVVTKAVIV